MLKIYKFRIYPDKNQEKKMELSLELCRQVYNRTLAERKLAYEESGKTLSKYTLKKLFPQCAQDVVYSLKRH